MAAPPLLRIKKTRTAIHRANTAIRMQELTGGSYETPTYRYIADHRHGRRCYGAAGHKAGNADVSSNDDERNHDEQLADEYSRR
jgi:hypothetical protein